MKNNSKVIYLAIAAIVIAIIGFFVYSKKNENVSMNEQVQGEEQASTNSNIPFGNKSAMEDTQNLPYDTPPKWAQTMMVINDNPAFSREEKIQKLVELLKQNEMDADALSAILITLTALNPIEAANEVIPYLKNPNARVQSAALGTLNNASLLTEKEHELKRSLPENEVIRKRIAEAVNELKSDPNITDEVKQALISTYTGTNPSLEDTRAINQEILNQDVVSANESSFIASSVLNGKDLSVTLSALDKKDANVKDSVISSIGASILENPDIVTVLSPQQREKLINFIRDNPPQSKNESFGYQNDQWNNTLNILGNNI
jgi:hypothetical protein